MELKPPDKPPNPSDYTQLELALYDVYTVGSLAPPTGVVQGVQYVKDVLYVFPPEEAVLLLQEEDHGRSVWKRHGKPPKPVQEPRLLSF